MNQPVSYMIEGTPDRAAAIRNAEGASFTLDGGNIEVTGADNDTTKHVYAVYDEAGFVDIRSGQIKATSGAGTVTEDEYGDPVGGNAYALYSTDYETYEYEDENGELVSEDIPTWTKLTIEPDVAMILASTHECLAYPDTGCSSRPYDETYVRMVPAE